MLKFCSLVSGSSGNSYVFSNGKSRFLIDAGVSGKQIEKRLETLAINPAELSGIFITHEHTDHVKGVGVLSRRYNLPVYANKETWKGIGEKIGNIEGKNQRFFITGEDIDHFSTKITSFTTSHDARESVGFVVENDCAKVGIATDLGCITPEVMEALNGSDLVVLESNHDVEVLKSGRYPYYLKRRILSDIGHLSNEDAGKTVVQLAKRGVKAFILAHLSEENNFPELAMTTVNEILSREYKEKQQGIAMDIAFRSQIGKIYKWEES